MSKRQPIHHEQRSIRSEYDAFGVQEFYQLRGGEYRNPHEPVIARVLTAAVAKWSPDLGHVLDLACGSGEVALALQARGAAAVHGIDPFTADAFKARTGVEAERLSFDDIASGMLSGRRYSLIVCSFALHLVEPSRLPTLVYQLSRIADSLLVLTPHKRPMLKPEWGWTLIGEVVVERVRARYYRSTEAADPA